VRPRRSGSVGRDSLNDRRLWWRGSTSISAGTSWELGAGEDWLVSPGRWGKSASTLNSLAVEGSSNAGASIGGRPVRESAAAVVPGDSFEEAGGAQGVGADIGGSSTPLAATRILLWLLAPP
jgi:hypothetical protein